MKLRQKTLLLSGAVFTMLFSFFLSSKMADTQSFNLVDTALADSVNSGPPSDAGCGGGGGCGCSGGCPGGTF